MLARIKEAVSRTLGREERPTRTLTPRYSGDITYSLEDPVFLKGTLEREEQLLLAIKARDETNYFNAVGDLAHWTVYKGSPVPQNAQQNADRFQEDLLEANKFVQRLDNEGARLQLNHWFHEFNGYKNEQNPDLILPIDSMSFAMIVKDTFENPDTPIYVDPEAYKQNAILIGEKVQLLLEGMNEPKIPKKLRILSRVDPQAMLYR